VFGVLVAKAVASAFSIGAGFRGGLFFASLFLGALFGCSFATWRFHLRGENIRSAVDVGWIHSLTVGRMMRPTTVSVQARMSLAAFWQDVPRGATQRAVVTDEVGRYMGIAYPAEAAAMTGESLTVAAILHHGEHFLLPGMNVQEALAAFEAAEADALAVVDGPETRQILGLLTEQYALRRYSEELDRRRKEMSGE